MKERSRREGKEERCKERRLYCMIFVAQPVRLGTVSFGVKFRVVLRHKTMRIFSLLSSPSFSH